MTTQIQQVSKISFSLPKVGNTPMILMKSMSMDRFRIWAKAEWEQSGGSLKVHYFTDAIKSLTAIHPSLSPYIYDEADLIRK